MKANDAEKRLSSPSGLELGEWCEHTRLRKMVRLHPLKDELFVAEESGRLVRWRYTPTLTFVDGLETEDIQDLVFSPGGKWMALSNRSMNRIDIRSTEDLGLLRQIQNEFTNECMFSLCLDQEGNWLVIDSCKKPGELDEDEGLAWIHLETGEAFARTWPEMDYFDPEEYGYGIVYKIQLSPDQKRLAVNEWKEGSTIIHIFPSLIKGNYRTGSLEERLFFDMKTGEFKRKLKVNGNYIYAIGWHRDGDKIRVATDRELQVIEWK